MLEKAKRGAGAPDTEVTGNCEPHTRVLGVELGSCARAACTELPAISPVSKQIF